MSNQALTLVAFVSFVGGLMALGMVDVGPAGRQAIPDSAGETLSRLAADVAARERAFAGSLAQRDHRAFATFLSDDAVFMSETRTLRGRTAVVEGWRPYFDGPEAPFSWQPAQVEVVGSGRLAFSSGPVLDASGARVGTFNSVWRLEPDGTWRVVFDKGCPRCTCP